MKTFRKWYIDDGFAVSSLLSIAAINVQYLSPVKFILLYNYSNSKAAEIPNVLHHMKCTAIL